MDAQLKAKWVEALRSGRYQQITSVLRGELDDQPGFCCLGVLCDVMGAKWDGTPFLGHERLQDDEEELLSPFALNLVGFDEVVQGTLFRMNDDEGASFSAIADYIEKNIPASEVSDDR